MPVMDVFKVTLGTGKIVLLREPQIRDQEMAAKAAGGGFKSDGQITLAIGMQKEMLKQLIVAIGDGKKDQEGNVAPPIPIKAMELENLDKVFTYGEYLQMVKVLEKVLGGSEDEMGNFQIEMSSSGEQ